MQRSVAFEKGSVLFNIGALYTQLAASEIRTTATGLEKAIEYFSQAAGVLHYLKENFSNSPSVDMRRDVVEALLSLLLAQAQECFFDLCLLRMDSQKIGMQAPMKLSEEAAQVSKFYTDTSRVTSVQSIKQYLPLPWLTLIGIKRDHYMAVAHYFQAISLLASSEDSNQPADKILPNGQTVAERSILARVHLKCAAALNEEALNHARMCKQLRQLSVLLEVLGKCQEKTERLRSEVEGTATNEEFDPCDLFENVDVTGQSIFDPTLIPPDFSFYKVVDLFRDLGPLNIFCARNRFTPPRMVHLRRTAKCPGYGFSVRGDAPVSISSVEDGGLASVCGLKIGDIIVGIGDHDTKWASHEDLVRFIRSAGDALFLTVVSPIQSSPTPSLQSISTASASSTCSSASSSPGHSKSNNSTSVPLSYSTLPSNLQQKKKKQAPTQPATANHSVQHHSNGIFTFSTLKNLKKRKSAANLNSTASSASSTSSNSTTASSPWNFKNLKFMKKYSKSMDSHLNSSKLYE